MDVERAALAGEALGLSKSRGSSGDETVKAMVGVELYFFATAKVDG